jgi:hypothetical protein
MLVMLGGCITHPTFTAQSVPPPGRSARLDRVNSSFWGTLQYYRLKISEGVALALTCDRDGPCEHMEIKSEDPSIAEPRKASLAALVGDNHYGPSQNNTPATGFVIIGKAPGTTWVRVRDGKGWRSISVTVEGPPAPNAQTAASSPPATP